MNMKLNISRIIALAAVLSLCTVILPVQVARAADYYVIPGQSIQAAITAASAGDTVHVAAGAYYELITLKDGVGVQGAGAGVTTISGNNSGTVVTASGVSSNTTLNGFTITSGNATFGGGMYNLNSSPTVTNCTFANNLGIGGGGMYNNNSSPAVTNCTFANNSAGVGGLGGGMYNFMSSPTVTNCTFLGNSASDGGGMGNNDNSSPAVTNCIFTGNSAGSYGGGMDNYENCSPTVTDCTFLGNTAIHGGGMDNYYNCLPAITNCTFGANSADYGGGIKNVMCSPTVTNCTFAGNSADIDGGGMHNSEASPIITGCTFSGNSVYDDGGGICNDYFASPMLTNCVFDNNTAKFGGGMQNTTDSSPTVFNCVFSNNSADYGGGMQNWDSSSPTVTNCTFLSNSANEQGGGMDNAPYDSSPALTNCSFDNNTADYGGGMNNNFSSPTVINCTFSRNSADYEGGGIQNWYDSSPTITNSTFYNNTAVDGGGMYNHGLGGFHPIPRVTNCIFWGDNPNEINNADATPTVSFCDILGGYGGGTNIINLDPFFVDDVGGDFHLQSTSPCINSGNNTAPSIPATDFEGDPRILGGTVDMGVDEYYATAVINEFVIDHTSTDDHEFVEIFGQPETDYSYLTILDIEGDAGANPGNIDRVYPAGTTDAAGFWWTGFLDQQLENGTSSLLLVLSFNGTAGSDVDTSNNGTIDNPLWNKVIDSIAVTDGGAGDRVYAPVILPSLLSDGASRYPDGSANWYRNDFDLVGIPGFTGTPVYGEAYNTPGATNQLVAPSPPEMSVEGNSTQIADGDSTPSSTDDTDFGNADPADSGIVHTFTIKNTGSSDLSLTGSPLVAVTGTNPDDFTVTQPAESVVPATGNVTFQVTFLPGAVGLRTATLSISNNDTDENPYDFAIQGTGTSAPHMDVTWDMYGIGDGDMTPMPEDNTDFGNVNVSSGAVTHNFTIENWGSADLHLTGTPIVVVTGNHSADFSVTQPVITTLGFSDWTRFQVTFNPSAAGLRTTMISIDNDDSSVNPYYFAIQGTGTDTETDLTITKTDSPDPVVAGEGLTYTIVVSNNGTADADDVSLTDAVPPELTGVQFAVDSGPWSPWTGNTTLGTIVSGNYSTVVIQGTVDSSVADETLLSNTASVSANTTDPDMSNNSASTDTTVNALTDLSVSKTDSPDPVIVGHDLAYRIIAYNAGPSDATGIVVTDILPPGVTFKSADTHGMGTFDSVSGNWSGFSLASGTNTPLDLVVGVNVPAVDETVLINTVWVKGDQTDPDETNNSASQATTIYAPNVIDPKTVELVKDNDGDGVPSPGDILKYTNIIRNTGHAAATGVVFTDTPDTNTMLLNGTVTTTLGTIVKGNNPNDKSVQVSIGTMPPNVTVKITFEVLIGNSVLPGVSNQAVVTGKNLALVYSDDPNTAAPNDATVIHIKLPPGVPGISAWGMGTLVLLLGGVMVWMMRRKFFWKGTS
jgi:uncharacterized repeat protein (TIGR01451 family)